jgi:integrase
MIKYDLVGRNVIAWAGDEGRRRAGTLIEMDFWSIRQHLMDKEGVGDKTAYDRLIVVKQMFKSAAKRRLIPASPFAGIGMSKPESAPQPCFTPEQTATLLGKADAHFKPLIATLAYAGLRFGEARDLLLADLVLENDGPGFIVVRRGGSAGKTKGRRQRRVPIHAELRLVLDGLPRQFDRVFTALPSTKYPDGGAPLNERRCLVAMKRLCKRCGFSNRRSTSFIPSGTPSPACARVTTCPTSTPSNGWGIGRATSSTCTTRLLHDVRRRRPFGDEDARLPRRKRR